MKKVCLFIILISFSLYSGAQELDSLELGFENNSLFEPVTDTLDVGGGLFEEEDLVNLTFRYDISSFLKGKNKDNYTNVELIAHLSENDSIVKNIRLKARGNFRKSYCYFPPIRLNFKHDPIKDSGFKGVNKIKLVTPCKNSKTFNEYILKEYLAYKIYNAVTECSFKVRLLKINFVDTGKKARQYTHYGFIIEPMKLVAARNNAVELKTKYVKYNELNQLSADRIALFQYLIANTDWLIKAGHNMKFMRILDVNVPGAIIVPYDFDYSGFVNTMYAEPQEWSSAENLTDRDYLGFCRSSEDNFNLLKKEFLDVEEAIGEEIMNFEYLSNSERKELYRFCEKFFDELKGSYAYRNISSMCREPY